MFKRMLVPIDGSHGSSAIVPYAAQLARSLGCHVDLLLVEPASGATLPKPSDSDVMSSRPFDAAIAR